MYIFDSLLFTQTKYSANSQKFYEYIYVCWFVCAYICGSVVVHKCNCSCHPLLTHFSSHKHTYTPIRARAKLLSTLKLALHSSAQNALSAHYKIIWVTHMHTFLYVFASLSICLSDSHSSYQMGGCCAFDCQGSVHSGRQLPAVTFGCLKTRKLSLDRQKALDSSWPSYGGKQLNGYFGICTHNFESVVEGTGLHVIYLASSRRQRHNIHRHIQTHQLLALYTPHSRLAASCT